MKAVLEVQDIKGRLGKQLYRSHVFKGNSFRQIEYAEGLMLQKMLDPLFAGHSPHLKINYANLKCISGYLHFRPPRTEARQDAILVSA